MYNSLVLITDLNLGSHRWVIFGVESHTYMHHNNKHTENNNEECFIVTSDDGDSISTGTLHSVGGTVVSVGVTVGVTEKTTEGVGLSSHRKNSWEEHQYQIQIQTQTHYHHLGHSVVGNHKLWNINHKCKKKCWVSQCALQVRLKYFYHMLSNGCGFMFEHMLCIPFLYF